MTTETLVFIGPPGCGKGTHASMLASDRGFVQVSVGELLRGEVEKGSELGRQVREIMKSGALVPDEVAIEVVRGALEGFREQKIIFDGFPRTLAQARMLDGLLEEFRRGVDVALFFSVEDSEVIKRISGRRMDPETGKIYHVVWNPPPPGVETVQRDDDREEVVRQRLKVYHEMTEPVVEYYREMGRLVEIDASGSVEQVYRLVLEVIDQG